MDFFLELNRQKNTNVKVLALVRNLEKSKKAFADYLDDENFEFLEIFMIFSFGKPITFSRK